MRFDVKRERRQMLLFDKFVLSSTNSFIKDSQKTYVLGPYIIIEEQLLPFNS